MYCIVTNLQPPPFRPLLTLLHTSAALENWETATPPKHCYIHILARCAQMCVIGCTHPLRCWPQGAVSTISISCTAAHVCSLSQLRNNYSILALLYLQTSKTCAIGCAHPLCYYSQGAVPSTISVPCTVAHVCSLRKPKHNYTTPASLYIQIKKTCASVRNSTHAPPLLLIPGCIPSHHFHPL